MDLDLSDLPEEYVEAVAEYLSLDDIIACSGVSRKWRLSFDQNRIWRKYHTIHPNYFHKQVSQLGHSSQDFVEGCEAKQHVFKELSIGKNLIQGKLHTSYLELDGDYCVDQSTDCVDKAGNHLLFLKVCKLTSNGVDIFNHELQMWNLNSEPVLLSSLKFEKHDPQAFSEILSHDGKIFYTSQDSVYAYDFCSIEHKLKLVFKVEIPKLTCSNGRYTYGERSFVITNNMLVAVGHTNFTANNWLSPVVYVWDMEGNLLYSNSSLWESIGQACKRCINGACKRYPGSKRCEKAMVEYSHNCPKHIAIYSFWGERVYPPHPGGGLCTEVCKAHRCVELFSLSSFQFIKVESESESSINNFGFLSNSFCLCYNSNLDSSTKVKVFNLEGTQIFQKAMDKNVSNRSILPGCDSNEFITVDNEENVVVYDISKQTEVIRFSVARDDISVEKFTLQNNLLVVMEVSDLILASTSITVWNYKTGQMLRTLNNHICTGGECFSDDRYFTRHIQHNDKFLPKIMARGSRDGLLLNRISVASFW